MKSKYNIVRLLVASALFGALASFASAGPPSGYYETLRRDAQFKKLKAGEKVAYVCNECKTVSEIPIESPEHAMGLCKEGASVTCPSCKKTTKVVMKGRRSDPSSRTEVTYVNDKGEECAFIAKVTEKK